MMMGLEIKRPLAAAYERNNIVEARAEFCFGLVCLQNVTS